MESTLPESQIILARVTALMVTVGALVELHSNKAELKRLTKAGAEIIIDDASHLPYGDAFLDAIRREVRVLLSEE